MWGKPTNTTTTRKTGYGMTTRAVGWFIQLEYVSCKKCDWLSMLMMKCLHKSALTLFAAGPLIGVFSTCTYAHTSVFPYHELGCNLS